MAALIKEEPVRTNKPARKQELQNACGFLQKKYGHVLKYCAFAIYKITYFLVPESTERFQLMMF